MVLAGCNALLPIGTHIGFHSHTQTVNGASGFAVTHFASIDNAVPAQRFGRAGSGASVATRRIGIVALLTDFRRAIATDSRPGGRGGRGNAIDHTQLGAAVAAHEIAVVPLL